VLAAVLMGKTFYSFCHPPRIITDPIPEPQELRQVPQPISDQERIEAQSFLESIWSDYSAKTKMSNQFEFIDWQYLFNSDLPFEYSESPLCAVAPYEHNLSNILLEFQNDPNVFVLPGAGLDLSLETDKARLKKYYLLLSGWERKWL
jgi:hypothetical protein